MVTKEKYLNYFDSTLKLCNIIESQMILLNLDEVFLSIRQQLRF